MVVKEVFRRKASQIPCVIYNSVYNYRGTGYVKITYWELDKNGKERVSYSTLVTPQGYEKLSQMQSVSLKDINDLQVKYI